MGSFMNKSLFLRKVKLHRLIFLFPLTLAGNANAVDLYEDAGICIGATRALEGQFPDQLSGLSVVAKSNISKIKKSFVAYDKWVSKRNECYTSGTNPERLKSCLTSKIDDANAVKFWYGYLMAASFSNNKSKFEVLDIANSTCVAVKEIPSAVDESRNRNKVSENSRGAGALKIVLRSVKKAGANSCEFFFEFENKTSLNITSLSFNTSFRDHSGAILGKNILQTKRLPSGVAVDERQYAMNIPCVDIKLVKLNSLNLLFVDGDSRRDLMGSVEALMVPSSLIAIELVK